MRRVSGIVLVAVGLGCARVPAPSSDDAAALLSMHREVIEAHLASDVDRLLAIGAEDYVVVGRGEVRFPSAEESRARLGPYLAATRFDVYRDAIPPIVRVSRDGTLGWVIVQVEARGMQRMDPNEPEQPLAFTSAWIELYEKRDGRWVGIGNVSNFK